MGNHARDQRIISSGEVSPLHHAYSACPKTGTRSAHRFLQSGRAVTGIEQPWVIDPSDKQMIISSDRFSLLPIFQPESAVLWQRYITMQNHRLQLTGTRHGLKLSALALFIAAFFPFWANAQTTTPEQMTLGFYKKYMVECSKNTESLPRSVNNNYFCGMNIKKYITKSLYEKIMRSYHAQPVGDMLPDSDPNYLGDSDYFTHTQDFAAEWASLISVKTIKEDKVKAVVRVFMDFPKNAGESQAICVRLQHAQNGWKIYLVDLALYNPLPDCKEQ